MESFAWRYRKSYSFHDWSNSDVWRDYQRISKNTLSKSIQWLIRSWLRCDVQKFIKIARHSWHPEFHRVLSSRPDDLMILWPYDLMTWWPYDMRIIILMSVSETDVWKIIVQNFFLIHDVIFNSNDLRYLSCHGDFSSIRSINSGPR
jgi:hypothetical protein